VRILSRITRIFTEGFKEGIFLAKTEKDLRGTVGRFWLLFFRCVMMLIKAVAIKLATPLFSETRLSWSASLGVAAVVEFLFCEFSLDYYEDGTRDQKIGAVVQGMAVVAVQTLILLLMYVLL